MLVPLDLKKDALVKESKKDDGDSQQKPDRSHMARRSLLHQAKWLRLGVLCLAGLLYVKTRSFVAGDQLVRIYRKVGGLSQV